MKIFKYLLILIGIFCNWTQLVNGDDLLELNCFSEAQCKQFQHDGVKATCIDEHCLCINSKGESVECRPVNSKLNNIIGGACPCQISKAECDKPQDVCYCVSQFMPSRDKRRCIPKTVALDQQCEQDSQCQMLDFNAICHESKKECKCMDNFVDNDGKCASIVGNKSQSWNDTECFSHYGNSTKYSKKYQRCICVAGHFASSDNSRCLKTARYLENCASNLQCIGTMGLGGECVANVCQCSAKYFVEDKKIDEGAIESVCTAIVERGHYCRYDKDCYQREKNESDQSMVCIYGECDCRKGFHSYNNSHCIKGGGASNKSLMGLQLMIIVLVFVTKYM